MGHDQNKSMLPFVLDRVCNFRLFSAWIDLPETLSKLAPRYNQLKAAKMHLSEEPNMTLSEEANERWSCRDGHAVGLLEKNLCSHYG